MCRPRAYGTRRSFGYAASGRAFTDRLADGGLRLVSAPDRGLRRRGPRWRQGLPASPVASVPDSDVRRRSHQRSGTTIPTSATAQTTPTLRTEMIPWIRSREPNRCFRWRRTTRYSRSTARNRRTRSTARSSSTTETTSSEACQVSRRASGGGRVRRVLRRSWPPSSRAQRRHTRVVGQATPRSAR